MTARRSNEAMQRGSAGLRRRSHRVMLVAVLAATALFLPSGPDRAGENGSVQSGLRLSACVPLWDVDTVAGLNRFVRRTEGVPELRGADVGIDALLGDGRRMWFFADTLQSPSGGFRLVRNSALLVDDRCARAVTGPRRGELVPDRVDGTGYWPMSVFATDEEHGTTVVVLAQRVHSVGPSAFDFETLGPSVAILSVPDAGTPSLRRVVDLGPDSPDDRSPTWGAAVARGRGWIYVYGTSTRPIPGLHGFALRVARTRAGSIADPGSWRYWDGETWRRDARRAVAVLHERRGVSQTLSVFRQGRRWWALSKQDEFLGTVLAVWPAPHPWGPFGAPVPLRRIPCDTSTGELTYMALAHPGLLPRPGTVVVSWSRNNPDVREVCADPRLYRPRFDRVRLPLP